LTAGGIHDVGRVARAGIRAFEAAVAQLEGGGLFGEEAERWGYFNRVVAPEALALEVARASVPMVTTHKVNPLSAWLVRRMMISNYVNLINILLRREVVEEYLQERCTAPLLAGAMEKIITDDKAREVQKLGMAQVMDMLASPHPHRAAEIVLADN
jgi:lipid-A-disaccharide synthase